MSTSTQSRPVAILNERVLMFVRLTAVLNERDAMNDKRRITKFVNDLDSAKDEARSLTSERNLGYIWMTQRYDTLKSDGVVVREEHDFQWTRSRQWVNKGVKTVTVEPTPEVEAPVSDESAPF